MKRGYLVDQGIEIEAKDGKAVGCIQIQEKMLNPFGAVHGGVVFGLADTAGGAALLSNIPETAIVTSTGTINYLRGTNQTKMLIAKAMPVKFGKTLNVYDVDIFDEKERLVAKAVMTYYILSKT